MNEVELNRELVLEAPQRVSDGAGGYVITWVEQGRLWADIRAKSGREVAGEEYNLASVTFQIVVRGAPFGVTRRPKAEQRLRDGNRVFHILAVTERDRAGQYLTCFAREEVPA